MVPGNWKSIKVFCATPSTSKKYFQIVPSRHKNQAYIASNRPKTDAFVFFAFYAAICVNVRLVKGQKAEILRIYHGHSMEKIGRSKKSFSSWNLDGACNRALHNCSLCGSITFAPKKKCGLWLTFFATCIRRSSSHEPY